MAATIRMCSGYIDSWKSLQSEAGRVLPQVVGSFQRTHLAFYEMTRQIQMQMMQQAQQMNQAPSLMTQSQQMTRQWGN